MSEHEHNWVKSFLETLESKKIEDYLMKTQAAHHFGQDLINEFWYYYFGKSSHKKAKTNDQKYHIFHAKWKTPENKIGFTKKVFSIWSRP